MNNDNFVYLLAIGYNISELDLQDFAILTNSFPIDLHELLIYIAFESLSEICIANIVYHSVP